MLENCSRLTLATKTCLLAWQKKLVWRMSKTTLKATKENLGLIIVRTTIHQFLLKAYLLHVTFLEKI